jgi:succinyl-CoA synthetase alpha subunit
MSILIDKNTRTIIQGITGTEGSFHTRHMLDYGTQVVAGVTPGKGGSLFDERIPVYNTVVQAAKEHNATASVIFVPGCQAADAIMEAAEAGIELVVCITEGIPALDMLQAMEYLKSRKTRLIGPNCPGIISPGKSKLGIMPGFIHQPGRVGVVSRSGTLTYEAVNQLSLQGIGQSTCIGIGGDMIHGTSFVDVLGLFENDSKTEAIVLIGEIGGSGEEEAARFIKSSMSKPVIAFIAGVSAPPQRRMGHAGAIISGSQGTVALKIKALHEAGATICHNPAEIGLTTTRVLSEKIKS